MTTSSGLSPIGKFDPQALKAFEPDYRFATPQEYINDANRHKLRQAVMRAAEVSLNYKVEKTPTLDLRVTPQNYLRRLADAQKSAAETSYMVDNILLAFPGNFEPEYQKEISSRWRADYNLTLGRLLASQAAGSGIQLRLGAAQTAWLRRRGQQDEPLDLQTEQETGGRGGFEEVVGRRRGDLLKRTIDNATDTPWAFRQRDLSIPFGFDVIQKYIPPPKPAERRPGPATPGKKQVQLADDTRKGQETSPAARHHREIAEVVGSFVVPPLGGLE